MKMTTPRLVTGAWGVVGFISSGFVIEVGDADILRGIFHPDRNLPTKGMSAIA
jgi:hypothetical protein